MTSNLPVLPISNTFSGVRSALVRENAENRSSRIDDYMQTDAQSVSKMADESLKIIFSFNEATVCCST